MLLCMVPQTFMAAWNPFLKREAPVERRGKAEIPAPMGWGASLPSPLVSRPQADGLYSQAGGAGTRRSSRSRGVHPGLRRFTLVPGCSAEPRELQELPPGGQELGLQAGELKVEAVWGWGVDDRRGDKALVVIKNCVFRGHVALLIALILSISLQSGFQCCLLICQLSDMFPSLKSNAYV